MLLAQFRAKKNFQICFENYQNFSKLFSFFFLENVLYFSQLFAMLLSSLPKCTTLVQYGPSSKHSAQKKMHHLWLYNGTPFSFFFCKVQTFFLPMLLFYECVSFHLPQQIFVSFFLLFLFICRCSQKQWYFCR